MKKISTRVHRENFTGVDVTSRQFVTAAADYDHALPKARKACAVGAGGEGEPGRFSPRWSGSRRSSSGAGSNADGNGLGLDGAPRNREGQGKKPKGARYEAFSGIAPAFRRSGECAFCAFNKCKT